MSLSPEDFFPGQRWLSEAETDLGLGIMRECGERMVSIEFPSIGETRNYAWRTAPLARAAFGENDHIEDIEGRSLTVREVRSQGPLLGYLAVDEQGNEVLIPETELSHRTRLNRPQEKLLSGSIDRDSWFDLRYRTWLHHARLARSPAHGLIGPRVALIPHQLHVASEVSSRPRQRVLLSDEVGLGKTIEAGLILHRLLLTGRIGRALILVPEPLLHQWLVELLRRFNLRVALFNEERLDDETDVDNPFLDEQIVLTSLSLLTSRPEQTRAALDGQWDMLVIDEAHHLEWSEEQTSLEYDIANALAQETANVLLLTATPEQLGKLGHFGRLRLLDAERFHDYAKFEREEQEYSAIAALGQMLVEGREAQAEEIEALGRLLDDELDLESPNGRTTALERLLDRHGTGRVLFRNTRASIEGFPERRLIEHDLPAIDAPGIEACLLPEDALGADWSASDPRVAWLHDLLRDLRPEKVLLICARAQTATELRRALADKHNIHCAVFHEGLSIIERDRAAAYFADPDEGCQALICSEIGSEGRNFQFAHHLVLFDLPTEPDLLEQRIGRLDRIGQSEDIKIHVPVINNSAMAFMHAWYRDALNAYERASGAGQTVRETFGDALERAISDPATRDALLADSARLCSRLDAELEAGRDRLLELHSHKPEQAERLRMAIEDEDTDLALGDYMADVWAAFGVDAEPGPGRTTVLHPGNHMLHDRFPGLPDDGITLTSERGLALAREDHGFLSWEHPMVQGTMDMIMSEAMGNTAFTVVRVKGIPPGTILLELLYLIECTAPRELGIDRFLPPTVARLLIDKNGRDHAAKAPHHMLKGDCMTHQRKTARGVIKSQQDLLRRQFAAGEELARAEGERVAESSRESARKELNEEIARLEHLAQVNPMVDSTDIDLVRLRLDRILKHMEQINVRLDAARVIVAS